MKKKTNLKFMCTCTEKKPCSHEILHNIKKEAFERAILIAEQNYAQRIFDDLSRCYCIEQHGCIHVEDLNLYKKKWGVK